MTGGGLPSAEQRTSRFCPTMASTYRGSILTNGGLGTKPVKIISLISFNHCWLSQIVNSPRQSIRFYRVRKHCHICVSAFFLQPRHINIFHRNAIVGSFVKLVETERESDRNFNESKKTSTNILIRVESCNKWILKVLSKHQNTEPHGNCCFQMQVSY